MSNQPLPPPAAERSDNDRRMFGLLREIRAACQYLQGVIAETLQKARTVDASQRAAFVTSTLSQAILNRVDQKITPQLAEIAVIFSLDAGESEWCSDYITRIELTWARVSDLWPSASLTSDQNEQRATDAARELDQVVYFCESLTLSPRINDIMCNLRTGQPLDIEFEFGSELPFDPALRHRLVLELAQQSAVVECGVVDVDQGVIYKTAPTRRQQKKSAWHLAGWCFAGLLIPAILAYSGQVLSNWPLKPTDLERLAVDYVLLFVGIGAHFAVESLKVAKTNTRPSFQALNDWVLWLHVRESQIVKGILYAWLGYLLLAFGLPKFDWTSAFFAGYSIDSVTELFLERFQSIVATNNQTLTAAAKIVPQVRTAS